MYRGRRKRRDGVDGEREREREGEVKRKEERVFSCPCLTDYQVSHITQPPPLFYYQFFPTFPSQQSTLPLSLSQEMVKIR